GIDENVCTMKLRENIKSPQEADFYNPKAGRITTANSQKLPALRSLQMSAERGFLYSNGIYAPHWNINAHSALYVTRGNAKVQVVGDEGNKVFDDEVKQGQLIIVPQYFAVIKKAGNQGFEYVAFKTNDNAMINPLVGRLSAFRAIPEEVLRSSFQISSEEAEELKYGRQEALLLSEQSQQGKREVADEKERERF
uniref:13S globulin basic chain n=1 Tax=Fagopyrum esculentum TaxID=3617 RepID=13SB_FAGES|nr:RecName: Full=13S globulin basic chain [Fagopyrum esculentum]